MLRDNGLSYMAYTVQITFLLFLKMADEKTKPPYKDSGRPSVVAAKKRTLKTYGYPNERFSPLHKVSV